MGTYKGADKIEVKFVVLGPKEQERATRRRHLKTVPRRSKHSRILAFMAITPSTPIPQWCCIPFDRLKGRAKDGKWILRDFLPEWDLEMLIIGLDLSGIRPNITNIRRLRRTGSSFGLDHGSRPLSSVGTASARTNGMEAQYLGYAWVPRTDSPFPP